MDFAFSHVLWNQNFEPVSSGNSNHFHLESNLPLTLKENGCSDITFGMLFYKCGTMFHKYEILFHECGMHFKSLSNVDIFGKYLLWEKSGILMWHDQVHRAVKVLAAQSHASASLLKVRINRYITGLICSWDQASVLELAVLPPPVSRSSENVFIKCFDWMF